MTAFDNKEKAEENKYAHDKELEFRIYAKYHGLLAAWVAKKAGLDTERAEKYKNTLITGGLGKNDPEALLHKIKQDLEAKNVHLSEHQIREEMHHSMQAAQKQVKGS